MWQCSSDDFVMITGKMHIMKDYSKQYYVTFLIKKMLLMRECKKASSKPIFTQIHFYNIDLNFRVVGTDFAEKLYTCIICICTQGKVAPNKKNRTWIIQNSKPLESLFLKTKKLLLCNLFISMCTLVLQTTFRVEAQPKQCSSAKQGQKSYIV